MTNLISEREYAILSNDIYNQNSQINSWTRYLCSKQDKLKFDQYFGCAYKKGNNLVIAHKGTQPATLYGILDDIEIALATIPNHYKEALVFINQLNKQIQNTELKIIAHTGHSLGGCLTELMIATIPSVKGIAFESPGGAGVVHKNPESFKESATASARLTIYNAAPNLINSADKHLTTNIIRLYPNFENPKKCQSTIEFTLQQHHMSSLKDQFDPISGAANSYGIMNNLWPLTDGWVKLKSSIPLVSEIIHNLETAFLDNYDKNPYFIESVFNDLNYNTARRIKEIKEIYNKKDHDINQGVTIFTNNASKNIISGGTNAADIINSGNHDDEIFIFSGNDIIKDSGGYDKYHFYLHNMKGIHQIHDADGKGQLYFHNILCPIEGKFPLRSDGVAIFNPNNHKECNVTAFSGHSALEDIFSTHHLDLVNFDHGYDIFTLVQKNGDLHINYSNSQSKDLKNSISEIVISNFRNGDFNITLVGDQTSQDL